MERRAIETLDAHERVGDFLAVRADVLDGRAADGARDARQALDTGPAALDGPLHERVPIDSGAGGHFWVRAVPKLDPADGDTRDETGEPRVGEHDIAAAAQHVHRETPLGGEGQRRAHLLLGGTLHKEPSPAAETKSGERRKRDMLAHLHGRPPR